MTRESVQNALIQPATRTSPGKIRTKAGLCNGLRLAHQRRSHPPGGCSCVFRRLRTGRSTRCIRCSVHNLYRPWIREIPRYGKLPLSPERRDDLSQAGRTRSCRVQPRGCWCQSKCVGARPNVRPPTYHPVAVHKAVYPSTAQSHSRSLRRHLVRRGCGRTTNAGCGQVQRSPLDRHCAQRLKAASRKGVLFDSRLGSPRRGPSA